MAQNDYTFFLCWTYILTTTPKNSKCSLGKQITILHFFFQCGYILSHWRGLIMHDSSLFYWVSSRVNSFNWCRTAQRRDYNGIGEFPLLLRMVCSLFSYFPIFYCITPRISIYLFLNLRPGSPGFISLLVSPGLPCQLTTPICILVLYYILAK